MRRVAVGIIIGSLWMLIAPFIFTEWEVNALVIEYGVPISLPNIFIEMGMNVPRGFWMWFQLGFHPDASIVAVITIPGWILDPNKREIAWMVIMAWLSTGFIVGIIIKGWKKSILAGFAVFVIYFAVYLIFTILAGEDLMTTFSGPNLWDSLGALLSGFAFTLLGAGLGSWA